METENRMRGLRVGLFLREDEDSDFEAGRSLKSESF